MDTKHRIIDFAAWLGLGVVFLLIMRALGPFALSSIDPSRGPSAGQEGRAMAELMLFVAGLSAILVGISHVFSPEYRSERAQLITAPAVGPPHPLPPGTRVERRHARHERFGFAMASGFNFSLAGLVLWLLPIGQPEKQMAPVLTLVFIVGFSLMTVLTALAAVLASRRRRLFDRRHHHRPATV